MRTVLRAYEPVFGGIVAALAAALLCFALFMPQDPGSHTPRAFLVIYGGMGISWGLLQVVGYRAAKRKGVKLEQPTLDMALGCVLLGLIFALVTVLFFLLAHNLWYSIATGSASALLLTIGGIVGIRKGTWRSDT